MASPQKENGYTRIADEIMEALARYHLSSYEWRCLLFIFRKTYGFNKKEDWISLSQFVEATQLQQPHVCRALKMLIAQNLITKGGTKNAPRYSFQKDYDKWQELQKGSRKHSPNITKGGTTDIPKGAVPKGVIDITKGGNLGGAKGGTYKRQAQTKDNITKDIPIPATSEDVADTKAVNEILSAFQMKLNPHINYGNKTQRKVAHELLKKLGKDKLLRTIDYAAKISTEQFAPTITTPYQLHEKMAQLTAYFNKNSAPKNTIAIIS